MEKRRVRYDNDTELDGTMCLLAKLAGNEHAIEDSEARGQRRLVQSTQLPIDGSDDPLWAHMGVTFGEKTDELFRDATLPSGWKLMATDHSMWSHVLDEHGRTRASVFYKAAFYDRRAHVRIERRYGVAPDYGHEGGLRCRVAEQFGKEERVLFTTSTQPEPPGWDERMALQKEQLRECEAWLDANRPQWRDPVAQWERA